MITVSLLSNEFEVSPFLTIMEFLERMKKKVLASTHRKFERVQQMETDLLGLQAQAKALRVLAIKIFIVLFERA